MLTLERVVAEMNVLHVVQPRDVRRESTLKDQNKKQKQPSEP